MKTHMTNRYASLCYLEGSKVEILGGIDTFKKPDEAVIEKDYPDTVLIRMKFTGSIWGLKIPPRYIRTQIAKASLACCDVQIKTMDGVQLHGSGISPDRLLDKDAVFKV